MQEPTDHPMNPASHRVVIMGVSGSGKSTVGEAITARLGVAYIDGDDHHPPANVDKMSHGTALTDADRSGWLDALASLLEHYRAADESLAIGCSSLKRSYRDRLRAGDPDLTFLFLDGRFEVIRGRMAQRSHFFSPDMLRSQFAILEPPGRDEAIRIDINDDWSAVVDHSVAALMTLYGQPAL